jgi:DNA invertase Pin-like site-specific DNA recombinase
MSRLLDFNLSLALFIASMYMMYRIFDRPKVRRYIGNTSRTGIYKWKRDVRKRVYDLHKQGYSHRKITSMTTIPKSTVHQIIQEQKQLNNETTA